MTLRTRLSNLEATALPAECRIWRRVIGRSEEECETKRRALIDGGQALESDNFVFRITLTPKVATCAT